MSEAVFAFNRPNLLFNFSTVYRDRTVTLYVTESP